MIQSSLMNARASSNGGYLLARVVTVASLQLWARAIPHIGIVKGCSLKSAIISGIEISHHLLQYIRCFASLIHTRGKIYIGSIVQIVVGGKIQEIVTWNRVNVLCIIPWIFIVQQGVQNIVVQHIILIHRILRAYVFLALRSHLIEDISKT